MDTINDVLVYKLKDIDSLLEGKQDGNEDIVEAVSILTRVVSETLKEISAMRRKLNAENLNEECMRL